MVDYPQFYFYIGKAIGKACYCEPRHYYRVDSPTESSIVHPALGDREGSLGEPIENFSNDEKYSPITKQEIDTALARWFRHHPPTPEPLAKISGD